jgi:hypothetical protein
MSNVIGEMCGIKLHNVANYKEAVLVISITSGAISN